MGDPVWNVARLSHRLLYLCACLLQSRYHVGLPISGHEVISWFLFLLENTARDVPFLELCMKITRCLHELYISI